ncbi:MAG: polymer-forming cytoskeletal protein [Halioglobus sp.]|nr:polymer-forming cytoskeletal protein [Halioglobus sp.]
MIGPSITIKGEVSGEEDLLIQGKVEGSIHMANNEVAIGESGQVNADIKAKVAKVDGEVNGDVTASEKVVISQSGNVRGNIVAPRVTLEDGAIFKGSIDMDPAGSSYGKPSQGPQKKASTDPESQHLDLKSA